MNGTAVCADLDPLATDTLRTLGRAAVQPAKSGLSPPLYTLCFGASAPLDEVQRHFGFEPGRVVAMAKELLARR